MRRSIAASRWRVRRTSTSWRWSSQARSTSGSAITRGVRVASSTFMFSGKRASSAGGAEQRLHQHLGLDRRGVFGSSTRRTVSVLSSRTSPSSGSFRSSRSWAICSTSLAFCT